jgi:hypothetical protein
MAQDQEAQNQKIKELGERTDEVQKQIDLSDLKTIDIEENQLPS